MSRPRRDPRAERARHGVGGGARPRFDLGTSPALRRPRRDPRQEQAALLVAGGARPRLDRAHAGFAATVAAPAARVLPAAPEPVLVADAALRVLAVADPGEGPLAAHDRQVMAAARLLAGPAGGIVLAADRAVPDAAALGADRVVRLPASAHPADRFEAVAALLAALDLPHVVLPESPDGADLARRLTARTGRTLLPGVEQVSARGLVRPVPGRRVDQEAREAPGIATVAADRIAPRAGDPPREARPVEIPLPAPGREASRRDPPRGSQALDDADFVVSAGNGIRDVPLFLDVAKALGGTAGASRVLCDAGLMPRAAQVGASGTVLAADCYLAFGIAGAPQHLQGIGGCRHVLAVNTDLHAAMVERAELAIVADAAPVMDALLRLLAEEEA